MKPVIITLLLSVGSFAQTPTKSWGAVGSGFSDPGWSAWACYATLVNTTAQVYSYSCYESLIQKAASPTVSIETGAATTLKKFGSCTIYGLGQLGASGSTTAVTSAFSLGGMGVCPTAWGDLVVGATWQKAGSASKPEWRLGWGKSW